MPFVHIRTAAPLALEQTTHIQQQITHLMARTLGKKAGLTAVLVEPAAAAAWSVGAEPVAIAGHIEATVTEGTNTDQQKAAFIEQAHCLLRDVLGSALPLATYVVVTEVPGASWGYGGQTQAHRAASLVPV